MSNHHPRPWLAAVLSLFFGPLGFLYAGRLVFAILFFFLTLGIRMLAFVTSGGVSLFASIAELVCWVGGAVLAWYLAKQRPAREPRWYSRWYGMAAVALALAAVVYLSRLFFYEPFIVPSSALLPTSSRGGRLIVNGRDTRIAELGIYRGAGSQGAQVEYLRMRERLGDTVFETLVQKQGPAPLDEPMAFAMRERCSFTREEMRCAVPPGYLFVLGDHRDFSQDSRYYGFVRSDQVIGRVVGIYR